MRVKQAGEGNRPTSNNPSSSDSIPSINKIEFADKLDAVAELYGDRLFLTLHLSWVDSNGKKKDAPYWPTNKGGVGWNQPGNSCPIYICQTTSLDDYREGNHSQKRRSNHSQRCLD